MGILNAVGDESLLKFLKSEFFLGRQETRRGREGIR